MARGSHPHVSCNAHREATSVQDAPHLAACSTRRGTPAQRGTAAAGRCRRTRTHTDRHAHTRKNTLRLACTACTRQTKVHALMPTQRGRGRSTAGTQRPARQHGLQLRCTLAQRRTSTSPSTALVSYVPAAQQWCACIADSASQRLLTQPASHLTQPGSHVTHARTHARMLARTHAHTHHTHTHETHARRDDAP